MSRDGDVYRASIEPYAYDFVQQLETDVCPIRDGWLEALVSEAVAASTTVAAISGARVEGDTLCSAKKEGRDECAPAAGHPEYIRQHINGNALYHMGDRLQAFLDQALDRYPKWPFDLASYLTANATNQLHLLRYTNVLHNRVVPVHSELANESPLYDPATYLVHCPSILLRPTQLDAAVATLSSALPAMIVGACASTHRLVLQNLHLSMQRQGLRNVIWVAQKPPPTAPETKPAILESIMGLRPIAFVESQRQVQGPGDPTNGCSPPLDVIEHALGKGHDVFYLDADAVLVGDLNSTLQSLDRGAVHLASAAVQSHGHYYANETAPRYMFTSKAFFMPASNASVNLIHTWRAAMKMATTPPHHDMDRVLNTACRCSNIASCAWNGTSLRLLPPTHFITGLNLVKQWPARKIPGAPVAYIAISAAGWGADADEASRNAPVSEGTARFRLQHADAWLLPQERSCCASMLVAEDVEVNGENATSVRSYVDLLLHMNATVAREKIACAVAPALVDSRTGERMAYEVIFDAGSLFHAAHVYPSIDVAPVCQFDRPSVVTNASVSDLSKDATAADGWRSWPLESFAPELRATMGLVAESPAIASAACLDDSDRSLAEAALHLMRGSARYILNPVANRATYVTGSWRVLDSHVQRNFPLLMTLLSPSLYRLPKTTPEAVYTSFGLRAQYPRLGDDVVMHVLDALVCRLASGLIARSEVPHMYLAEVYAGLLEFVAPEVLGEDLLLVEKSAVELKSASKRPSKIVPGLAAEGPPTYLLPLDTLDNNGFSNTVNAAQVLAYTANKTGVAAAMVPLSLRHRKHAPRPWSDVIADVGEFYAKLPGLRPPTWALLRHPSLLVEVLDGYMLSAGTVKLWTRNATCRVVKTAHGDFPVPCMANGDDAWGRLAAVIHSPRTFRRFRVASNAAEWEEKLLRGEDVVISQGRGYLGLSDDEMSSAIASRTAHFGRDIVFRPFRAFNFQNANAGHLEFASSSWAAAFKPARALLDQTAAIVQSLASNYTCYHARVADEFMAQHQAARPQFAADNVFRLISQRMSSEGQPARGGGGGESDAALPPSVYITSDDNNPVQRIVVNASSLQAAAAATSCRAFGCAEKDHVSWGIIERLVCASAATFLGNIYSTFTLSVCALRNDQPCRDLFNQTLSDGRLLF